MLTALKNHFPLRQLRRWRYERRFWRSNGVLFKGVYRSFAEALRDVPPGQIIGWDHAQPAGMFRDLFDRINPRDYPVLFWLRSIWMGRLTIFDYGGHVGVKRYAFEKYLPFDAEKFWAVCDVPAVTAAGTQLARKGDAQSFVYERVCRRGRRRRAALSGRAAVHRRATVTQTGTAVSASSASHH